MRHRWIAALLAVASVAASARIVRADEGMWTFDNFPAAKVQKAYGFRPSAAFLSHVRAASLRIAGGCSASFISPDGLVMTNHHCVVGCVGALSTPQQDLVAAGYVARRPEDEKACPNFELDQLVTITDVTKMINAATAGKTGAAANAAIREAQAKAQASCGSDPAIRCDVISLYHGGIYDLYRYRKYTDVRLVFAPEFAIGQFGGDPDNFNFPRFGFDLGLLRAYVDGKPAATPDYLRFSPNGSKAGELVFVSGNPGGTSRELTVAQLAYERDYSLPLALMGLAETRGVLEDYQRIGPEQERQANESRFFVENSLKAEIGRRLSLVDPQFFGAIEARETALRAAVARNPKLAAADGSAWAEIARLQQRDAELAPHEIAASALRERLLNTAIALVRAAAETKKPNGARLPEYTDQALVRLRYALAAPTPVYKDLEERLLALGLKGVREQVGADDPLTRTILGNESPDGLAHRLVAGTKLDDPAVRTALLTGGQAAIDASTDPMIVYAKAIDPALRAIRKQGEDEIGAPERAAAERIARARFAVYGTSIDPDATFTARLSYGSVKGFQDTSGKQIAPYTTVGGLFARATGADPYALPRSWLDAKSALDPSTPMDLSTTNDIIGGNSGSPLIDDHARVVGLIFDGNIYSLGGDFGYDPVRNRSVAVDSRAIIAGLSKVYHFDRVVTEIETAAAK